MWSQALKLMLQIKSNIYGPKSFIEYCREEAVGNASQTAKFISIDHFELLHNQLKDKATMVLRLGSPVNQKGTNFALIQHQNVRDFFFFDQEIFLTPAVFYEVGDRVKSALSLMRLFEKPSEMMLVSYLISTGVLNSVLGLDEPKAYYTPLTGRNCFTFSFKPTPNHELLTHQNGQVEIDAVFTGSRGGKPVIVVAEAKQYDKRKESLAKHKLFYAYKSVQSVCQEEFEIIPIYLKLAVKGDCLMAKIAECCDESNSLVDFKVKQACTIKIRL